QVLPAAELDEVVHQQEVAGEAQLLDEVELAGDAASGRYVMLMGRRVAVGRTLPGQLPEPAHLVVAGREGEVGQVRRGHGQVEGTCLRHFDGALDGARPADEAAVLLGGTAEVGAGGGGKPAVEGVERAA